MESSSLPSVINAVTGEPVKWKHGVSTEAGFTNTASSEFVCDSAKRCKQFGGLFSPSVKILVLQFPRKIGG